MQQVARNRDPSPTGLSILVTVVPPPVRHGSPGVG
ncbi:hypothetical protein Ae406Ps2_1248 [Pseudonocardia sp. Ae406_Ps2]|nr:hypothetical protein Ae406Ps2_1248 [Pseudonocardia sp. Ae406_Ps2]OLM06955.1 hypothetical protein Ae331Ps2_4665c [Pseudonocardia sp. Ae331_Ps2]OLM14133.1 hypothetical protein Ae505Ps2_4263c [Pseudonocardia sp. Ae505_Ps2]OLM22821.1 hypothetical protein Ae706Ps2_1253 [Pseudonocardia sp. Ae706_Ps2]